MNRRNWRAALYAGIAMGFNGVDPASARQAADAQLVRVPSAIKAIDHHSHALTAHDRAALSCVFGQSRNASVAPTAGLLVYPNRARSDAVRPWLIASTSPPMPELTIGDTARRSPMRRCVRLRSWRRSLQLIGSSTLAQARDAS